MREKVSAEERIREIRRKTRKKYSAEGEGAVVLEGLRGEESIAELCRKEGIRSNLYYRFTLAMIWSAMLLKTFTNIAVSCPSTEIPCESSFSG